MWTKIKQNHFIPCAVVGLILMLLGENALSQLSGDGAALDFIKTIVYAFSFTVSMIVPVLWSLRRES